MPCGVCLLFISLVLLLFPAVTSPSGFNPQAATKSMVPVRKRMKGFKILLLPGGSKSAMQETWVWSLGVEDSPGEGNGNPLQYSCLENPMDRGAWWATVHGVTKSWKQLSLSVSGLHPYCQRASLTMWIRDPSAWYLHLSWLLSQISFFVVFTGSSIVAHLHLEGGRSDWTDELSEWWIQYS